jgi:glycosyltransferase involved in cell wall biosynthesis
LTKILLVPSVVNESFGRVAAEALINGIPPIVSDRGALPETVRGAGRVLPLPERLIEEPSELPDAEAAQPWVDAVLEWWDDDRSYAQASAQARRVGEELYGESVQRAKYLDYFASLRATPAPPLFED